MAIDLENSNVCEACGCAGEMGFIIKEGDEIAEVSIFAANKTLLDAELTKYIELAKQISTEISYNVEYQGASSEEVTELKAYFKFEVSAEKLIFELKSRSLNR